MQSEQALIDDCPQWPRWLRLCDPERGLNADEIADLLLLTKVERANVLPLTGSAITAKERCGLAYWKGTNTLVAQDPQKLLAAVHAMRGIASEYAQDPIPLQINTLRALALLVRG